MQPGIRSNRSARFNALMGMAMAAIVVLGFSRTYYLKELFETPPLTLRLHLHGLALTLWLVLFVVQASLVERGRLSVHKTLGIAGAVLAAFIVAVTFAAAIEAARLDGDHGGITAVDRLYSSVLVISIFGLFVATAIVLRRRPEIHKRLMLLATITVIGPGVTRAVAFLFGRGIRDPHIPVESVLVLLALIYDWRTRGRPHWILLGGGVLTVGLQLTRRLVGGSEVWAHVGSWLIQ
jgi:uncharacterized membrane protein YozB (DUF420 family)